MRVCLITSLTFNLIYLISSFRIIPNVANGKKKYRILYSTSYTSGVPGIQESFDVSFRTVVLLGMATYLLGLALGCLVLAPLSEMYGRRPIYLLTHALYAALILPVALAPNLAAILASRVFSGFFGSAVIASAPGTVNDVVSTKHRALAFSLWSLGAMNGPVLGKLFHLASPNPYRDGVFFFSMGLAHV